MKDATLAVHAGQEPDSETGAITQPIYMTSTFLQNAKGPIKGYEYTRAGNPNFTQLEVLLAALEKGKFATVFSSGLGALTALVSTLKSGDTVVALNEVYGGTYRLLSKILSRFSIHFIQISSNEVVEALKTKPKYFIFETPTNPLLNVYEIDKFVKMAHSEGVKVVVDNTFASPINQNPLLDGADIVWHSTTKYIGGHSDLIGGVLITDSKEYKEAFDFGRKAMGLNPSPFDAWLTTRGIKTLAIRMKTHNENGKKIADWLSRHPKVSKVYYPGFSGMVSAKFNLPLADIKNLITSFKLFALAESLGGVESFVCHPASMTHASMPSELLQKTGITDNLVRFSVGIEDSDDLIADLQNSLA